MAVHYHTLSPLSRRKIRKTRPTASVRESLRKIRKPEVHLKQARGANPDRCPLPPWTENDDSCANALGRRELSACVGPGILSGGVLGGGVLGGSVLGT